MIFFLLSSIFIKENKVMKKIYSLHNKEYRMIVTLLLVAFLLLQQSLVKADSSLEITGTVQVKTSSSITVNSIEFLVSSSTKISSNMNSGVTFDSVKVGSLVKIEGKTNTQGKLEAEEIKLISTKINFEISGAITALSTNSITVSGTNIFIDTSTIIYTQFHAALTFSDLKIGDNVVVKVAKSVNGQDIAVVIMVKTKNTEQEIELSGKIQLLTSNSITIQNIKFYTNASTIIIAKDKGIIKFSDLKIGDDVEVRGYKQVDSSYLALYIKVEGKNLEQKELEVEGLISATSLNSITVNTVTFFVDSSTVISAHEGVILNLGELKIGDRVEVKAILQADGSYKALKIELENDESAKAIVVTGMIDVVNSDNIVVGSNKIYVNNQTKIYGMHHQKIAFANLAVGSFIVAKAYLLNENYFASTIKVRESSKTEFHLTGAIESINGASITIKGLILVTDQNTDFVDENRNTISINDLKVGQIISVDAQLQSGNQYIALKIIARKFWRPTVIVEGLIENLTLTSLTVMGKTFSVDSSTLVVGTGSGVFTFASLSVGLAVEVKGSLSTSGVLTAKLIKLHPSREFKLYGKIESISGTKFVVGGLTFVTDQSTVYYNEFDNSVLFDSLKPNQYVEVRYVITSSNENLAIKVEIEKEANSVRFEGIVSSVSSSNVQISGNSILLNSNTLFITSNYTQSQPSLIQPGQNVTIWANQDASGSLSAVQVQQINSSVTQIKEDKTTNLPSHYALNQNYPNPFNPSTLIKYTLAKQEYVSLVVFNIIGEKIATLINTAQSPGTHSVKFNAANLPSGIYFYRLEAGNFVDVKKMILLK